MKIELLCRGMVESNCYALENDGEAVLIDAGAHPDDIDAALKKRGLRLRAILLTHGHFDHLLGAEFVCRRYDVPFAMSSKDKFLLENGVASAELFGVRAGDLKEIDIDLDAEQTIRFGNSELRVIKTPGHTPGHVCLYAEEHKVLFTGDTLFRESIGRTDLPGGDYSWIMRSILDSILPLGDEVKIYPGHGEESNIGHESMYNPFIVEVLNQEVNYKN